MVSHCVSVAGEHSTSASPSECFETGKMLGKSVGVCQRTAGGGISFDCLQSPRYDDPILALLTRSTLLNRPEDAGDFV